MAKVKVLIEVEAKQNDAFMAHEAALRSSTEAAAQAEQLVAELGVPGVEISPGLAPIPLFSEEAQTEFAAFSSPTTNPDVPSESLVVAATVDESRLKQLAAKPGVKVFPNSEITLYQDADCRPFRAAVPAGTIRALLGVGVVWRDGFLGQNLVVGIVDAGIDGRTYPVTGGSSLSSLQPPGAAAVTSHGSMCAADVLVSAPLATLYDYPFLGVPDSGGVLTMYQAILEQRRLNGTPHLTNNSYGFLGVPPKEEVPTHEIHDLSHPLHRKIREVIASGAPAFFAAGNCGLPCHSSNCDVSGIGPGVSIHASNSLADVITIAAVNSRRQRIGYSSQGPGMFEPQKPDVAAYSHFLGNFGPGRPGGILSQLFDNGTSAASPLAAGVGALLMSAFPGLSPALLKEALIAGAIPSGAPGWTADTGHGVISAAASYAFLRRRPTGASLTTEVSPAKAGPEPAARKRKAQGQRRG